MENIERKNDEVSIFDLMLVIVKYRKLILIGTLAALFLGALSICVPMIKEKTNKDTVKKDEKVFVTYVINEKLMPYDLRNKVFENDDSGVRLSVADLCVDYVNKDRYIASVNKKYPVFGKYDSLKGEGGDEFTYNAAIKKLWSKDSDGDKVFVVKKESFGRGFSITMKISKKNLELSKSFVEYIVKDTEKNLESYILPKIDSYVSAAEFRIQNGEKITDSDTSAYSVLKEKDLVNKAKSYIDSFDGFIYLEKDSFAVSIQKKDKVKKDVRKSVVLVLGVFFVLIVLSFILNAISNLKKDPESSEAFKSAWKAGKFSKK